MLSVKKMIIVIHNLILINLIVTKNCSMKWIRVSQQPLEKNYQCIIVKHIILSKYKLRLGTKWSDQLAEELHKPIIKKFPLRRVMVSGLNEIWSADLIDMR